MAITVGALGQLERSWTVLLTTFKRDGTPVDTPVNLASDGTHGYFRSYDKAWKTKRLRRDGRVRLAPSGLRGAPRRRR